MVWALSCNMRAEKVTALLDEIAADSASRSDFEPSMPRSQAEAIIHAALWAHESRSGSTASGYAWTNVYEALGIDMFASKIVFAPSPLTPATSAPTAAADSPNPAEDVAASANRGEGR